MYTGLYQGEEMILTKEEALDRTLWGTRFRRVYGPVVRQTVE